MEERMTVLTAWAGDGNSILNKFIQHLLQSYSMQSTVLCILRPRSYSQSLHSETRQAHKVNVSSITMFNVQYMYRIVLTEERAKYSDCIWVQFIIPVLKMRIQRHREAK